MRGRMPPSAVLPAQSAAAAVADDAPLTRPVTGTAEASQTDPPGGTLPGPLQSLLQWLPQRLVQSTLVRQGFFFCLVGGVNTLVDLAVLNLLIWIQPAGRSGWLYSLFKTLGFLVAVTNSYFLNHRFTFKSDRQKSAQQMSHYLLVSLVGLLINVGIASGVATFVHPPEPLLPFWPSISALCGIPFGMVWNFFGYRLFVF